MQLCSSLIKKCNNQDDYAICLIKNNKEIGTGNTVQFQLYFYILKYYRKSDKGINFFI